MLLDRMSKTGKRQAPGSMIASQIKVLAGGVTGVHLKRERAWASITFSGIRYGFSIEWPDTSEPRAVLKLARLLPDHEFAIPGYFVADAVITEQSHRRLLVEILCIVDPVEGSRDC